MKTWLRVGWLALGWVLLLTDPAFCDDGGTSDAPVLDAGVPVGDFSLDAGVMPVAFAHALDGTPLPPGWWLSDARMQRVGTTLVDLQNRNAQLTAAGQCESPIVGYVRAALVGVAVGLGVGVGGTLWLQRKVSSP